MRRKWLRVTRYGLRVERLGSGFEGLPEYAKLVTGPHRSDPMPAARNCPQLATKCDYVAFFYDFVTIYIKLL